MKKNTKRVRAVLVAALLGSSLMAAGCHDGRPGHNSDHHHGGHHDHDHDHDGNRPM